jgi:hypothetical protein
MSFGQFLELSLSVSLEIAVLVYLARHALSRFPHVFLYTLFQVCSVVILNICSIQLAGDRVAYARVYWILDSIQHGLILLLIVSLIGKSLEGNPSRARIIRMLAFAILCLAAASFALLYDTRINFWMIPVSRNFSFLEEMFNLALWTLLLQRREFDFQLLLVSAGIGVQVTGEVIGHTLRLYSHSPSTVWFPNLLVYVSEVCCLAIWLWAFRKPATVMSPASPEPGEPAF